MSDYYTILGVDRSASAEEIKRAYRKLASQHHPDRGGDTSKFQEIQSAYDTLSDAGRRANYDNPAAGGMPFGHANHGPFDFDSIFDIFGTRFSGRAARSTARMSLWITLDDVARAGPKLVSVGTSSGTQTIEIEIPPGINDGDSVQYQGLAPGGQDLVVSFRIKPDSRWQKNGNNLLTESAVTVWQLIAGGEIALVDLLGNRLIATVPARTQPNAVLRLKGRGLLDRSGQKGDILIKLVARIPAVISDKLLDAINSEIQDKHM